MQTAYLLKAGSGLAMGVPDSAGVPDDLAKHTLTVPYNDLDAVKKAVAEHGKDMACIIVEPVAANMGVVPPKEGFLEGLRKVSAENNILLIFDEVITGFRLAYGGAQEYYNIKPDPTCLGKIIGGGLPIGAYGGRRDIMEKISPLGAVYQAGTLSGNPVAVTAGIETLKLLKKGVYKELEKILLSCRRHKGRCKKAGISAYHTRVGSILCTFFTPNNVIDYASAKTSDTKAYAKFFCHA